MYHELFSLSHVPAPHLVSISAKQPLCCSLSLWILQGAEFLLLYLQQGSKSKGKTLCLIQKLFLWKSDPKCAGSRWINFSFARFGCPKTIFFLKWKCMQRSKIFSLNANYRCTGWTNLTDHWCQKELPPHLSSLPWLWCSADPELYQLTPQIQQPCFWQAIKVHLPSTRSAKHQDLCQRGDGKTQLEAERGHNSSLQPGGRNQLSCSI